MIEIQVRTYSVLPWFGRTHCGDWGAFFRGGFRKEILKNIAALHARGCPQLPDLEGGDWPSGRSNLIRLLVSSAAHKFDQRILIYCVIL